MLSGTVTLENGATETFHDAVGTVHTHFLFFPSVEAFRFPFNLFPPAPGFRVDISGTRTFYASDQGFGSGFQTFVPDGVSIHQTHLRSPLPADNVQSPPAEVVPDPRAGQPFLVAPETDSYAGGAYVMINFTVPPEDPRGQQMHQVIRIVWGARGGPPSVFPGPVAPYRASALSGAFALVGEVRTLEELIRSRLGTWQALRFNVPGPAVIPLEAKKLAIENLKVEEEQDSTPERPRLRIAAAGAMLSTGFVSSRSQWDVYLVDSENRAPVKHFSGFGSSFADAWDGIPESVPPPDPELAGYFPYASLLAGVSELVHIGTHVSWSPGRPLDVVAFLRDPDAVTIVAQHAPAAVGVEVTISASAETIRPLETGEPNAMILTVRTRGTGGEVIRNQNLRFVVSVPPMSLEGLEDRGGHAHSGNRPLGKFRVMSAPSLTASPIGDPIEAIGNLQDTYQFEQRTDENGERFLKYAAPNVGGQVTIKAFPVGATLANPDSNSRAIDVAVLNLRPLQEAPLYYDQVGGKRRHPGPPNPGEETPPFASANANHYGMATFNLAIEVVSRNFRDDHPGIGVYINDMSLPKGGLFDAFTDWQRPHDYHREGTSCDYNTTVGLDETIDTEHEKALKFYIENNEPPMQLYPEGDHWHIYFEGGGP